MSIVGPTTE